MPAKLISDVQRSRIIDHLLTHEDVNAVQKRLLTEEKDVMIVEGRISKPETADEKLAQIQQMKTESMVNYNGMLRNHLSFN